MEAVEDHPMVLHQPPPTVPHLTEAEEAAHQLLAHLQHQVTATLLQPLQRQLLLHLQHQFMLHLQHQL